MKHHLSLTDAPIELPEEDTLGRSPFAENLAHSIKNIRGETSLVFGISGEWGTGKSSVLNMIEHFIKKHKTTDAESTSVHCIPFHCDPWWLMLEHFIRESKTCDSEPIIIRFNPWWFSGRDQLLPMFFSQLDVAIGRSDDSARMKKLGKSIQTYAKALRLFGYLPGAGVFKDTMGWIAEAGGALIGAGERASRDANQLRNDINRHLRDIKRRIIVFMDDLDRMTPSEMSDIFQLIKAIANFPYMTYVLAYDSSILAKSISRELNLGKGGHDYLKKIVNIQYDLPPVSQSKLNAMLTQLLHMTFANNGDITETEIAIEIAIEIENIQNYFAVGIEALLQNPRLIKEVVNHYQGFIAGVGNDVCWTDMFVLSVIYVTAPEAYRAIANNKHWFLEAKRVHLFLRSESNKQTVTKFHDGWINKIAPSKRDHVKNLIALLFPNAGFSAIHWNRSNPSSCLHRYRVASADGFDSYFQHRTSEGRLSKEEWNFFLSNIDNADVVNVKILEFSNLANARDGTKINCIADLLNRAWTFIVDKNLPVELRTKVLKTLLDNEATIVNSENREGELSLRADNASNLLQLFYQALCTIPEPDQICPFIKNIFEWNTGIRTIANFLGNKKEVIVRGDVGKIDGIDCILSENFPPIPVALIDHSILVFCEHLKKMAQGGQFERYAERFEIIRDWMYIDSSGEAKVWLEQQAKNELMFFWQIIEVLFRVPTVSQERNTYHYRPGRIDFYFQDSVAKNLSQRILDERPFDLAEEQEWLLCQIIDHPPIPV